MAPGCFTSGVEGTQSRSKKFAARADRAASERVFLQRVRARNCRAAFIDDDYDGGLSKLSCARS